MAFTESEIREIANVRGQKAVFVLIDYRGREKAKGCWLLVDALPCSVDQLAQSLRSDAFEDYSRGVLVPFDSKGNLIENREEPRNWQTEGFVRFFCKGPEIRRTGGLPAMGGVKFTKANLYCTIRRMIDQLYVKYKFDPGNGTSQVENKSSEANRAYGQLRALESLLRMIECGNLDDAKKYEVVWSQEPTLSGKPRNRAESLPLPETDLLKLDGDVPLATIREAAVEFQRLAPELRGFLETAMEEKQQSSEFYRGLLCAFRTALAMKTSGLEEFFPHVFAIAASRYLQSQEPAT